MSASVDPFVHCDALLAEGDPDRRLACLFLPAEKRPAVTAVYAFNLEIARIGELVSGPLPGEIRFQWWRDALEGRSHGDVRSNPVAAALLDAIARYRLPLKPFLDLIDARIGDLYGDLPPTMNDLEGYCGETSSVLIRIASLVLADGDDPGPADPAGSGGVAYALSGLLTAFPYLASRGRVILPRDLMERHGVAHEDVRAGKSSAALCAALGELAEQARRRLSEARAYRKLIPKRVRPAFAPLALVEPRLGGLADRSDPFRPTSETRSFAAPFRLWRAAAFGIF
jgi:phytoene synthase